MSVGLRVIFRVIISKTLRRHFASFENDISRNNDWNCVNFFIGCAQCMIPVFTNIMSFSNTIM